jgi:hypothetical protein
MVTFAVEVVEPEELVAVRV